MKTTTRTDPPKGCAQSPCSAFIVLWDDQMGVCAPMVWDRECEGAICAGVGDKDSIAIFQNRKAARHAIDISTKWNALLKTQGKVRNEDFEGESRKHLRVVPCKPNTKVSDPKDSDH